MAILVEARAPGRLPVSIPKSGMRGYLLPQLAIGRKIAPSLPHPPVGERTELYRRFAEIVPLTQPETRAVNQIWEKVMTPNPVVSIHSMMNAVLEITMLRPYTSPTTALVLGAAAITHDAGKYHPAIRPLYEGDIASRRLSEEEQKASRRHPELGVQVITQAFGGRPPPVLVDTALLHHAPDYPLLDGRSIALADIPSAASALALIDRLEAATTRDRLWKIGIRPRELFNQLLVNFATKFHPE